MADLVSTALHPTLHPLLFLLFLIVIIFGSVVGYGSTKVRVGRARPLRTSSRLIPEDLPLLLQLLAVRLH